MNSIFKRYETRNELIQEITDWNGECDTSHYNEYTYEGYQEFTYMLLGRLLSDAQSYIDFNGRLWGVTPNDHAEKMIELWCELKIKPVWLTKRKLNQIVFKLTKKETKQ